MNAPRITSNRPPHPPVSRLRILAGLVGFTMFAVAACSDDASQRVASPDAAQPLTPIAQPPPSTHDEPRAVTTVPARLEPSRPVATTQPVSVDNGATRNTAPAVDATSRPTIDRGVGHIAPPKPEAVPGGTLQTFDVAGDFGVVAGGLATGVEGRTPTGIHTRFTTETDRIWAFIKVKNRVGPTHVTMIWKKNGKAVWRYDLRVGKSSGWRTWSRKRVRAWDAGEWSVEVVDAEGKPLVTLPFTIAAAVDGPKA